MEIKIKHGTTAAKARGSLQKLLEETEAKLGHYLTDLKREWKDDALQFAFKASGMKVSGSMEVNDHDVIVKGKLPLLALPFEKKIRTVVETEAKKLFPKP